MGLGVYDVGSGGVAVNARTRVCHFRVQPSYKLVLMGFACE